MDVARARIGAVHQPAAVGQAEDGEVRAHIALVIQEMGVDALPHRRIAADLGRAQPFHQRDMIRPFDIGDMEVRQVDEPAIGAQLQLFGIRHAPEMAIVPLVLAHRHLIGVFLQQMLVRGIAVRAFPAAQLHEIAAQLLLALPEGRAADAAPARERLARVDRRIVDLGRRLQTAFLDELRLELERVEARIIDAGMVDRGAPVGHPVGDQLAHAGAVLHPDADRIPQAAHLLALADRRPAVGGRLQQPVERMAFVIAQLAQNRRQLHRALQRRDDLLHLQVALRRRQAGEFLFQQIARVDEARGMLLVIAPFDLAALGRLGVAGVAHIGRIALIAQQRIADVLPRPLERGIGPEEGQRMVDREDRQVLARHLRDQPPPQARADHDVIGHDRAARRDDALDPPILDDQRFRLIVGEDGQRTDIDRLVDQLARHRLRPRHDQPCIRIPQPALDQAFLDQREFRLDRRGVDQFRARAERLARGDLAADLVHALIVADPRDLQPADPRIMPHLLEEVHRVERRPRRQIIVAGRVAKVGGMRGGADVGRHARLVDADDIGPAPLDQMVDDRCADDAADADDHDTGLFGERSHSLFLSVRDRADAAR